MFHSSYGHPILFTTQRDTGQKLRFFFHTTPAYDAPFAGPVGITIAITFGADIVEWWAYKIVKKVGEYVYWFRHNTQM